MEWLQPVLEKAKTPGLFIDDIVSEMEAQRGTDIQKRRKISKTSAIDFNLDELAVAIEYLTDTKVIHKLGISQEKYVHHKVRSYREFIAT